MTSDSQMRRHFHEELDQLQKQLLEMAGLVEQSLARATDGRPTGANVVFYAVLRADGRTEPLQIPGGKRVMELLALHQPMASDLRQIITTSKISNDLERIGDHAVNIARATHRMRNAHPVETSRELSDMVEVTREMVSDSLAAYVSRNPSTARMVCVTDDRVDDLRRSLFRILVTHMLEDPKRISAALELLLISQNLERAADLATNIAEDVVFLVEGRSIKHGAEAAHQAPDD